jgi:hypothetical protein
MSAAPEREGSWAVPPSVAARLAAIRAAARPSEDNERPTLALIHGGTAPRRTIPFIVVVSLLLAVGLIGLLVLNTTLAQGSFTLNDLQKRSALLADEQQQLTQIVAVAQSPQQLATQAGKLGMVPEPNPVFITTNGKVLGVATPAKKKVVKPKPTAAATAAAAATTPATAASPAAATAPTVAATSPATNQPTSTPSPGTR